MGASEGGRECDATSGVWGGATKFCIVHDHRTQKPIIKDGEEQVFASFLWAFLYRDDKGWIMNFICFLNAIIDNLRWQSYAGVFSWGCRDGGWFFGFTPGMHTHYLFGGQ